MTCLIMACCNLNVTLETITCLLACKRIDVTMEDNVTNRNAMTWAKDKGRDDVVLLFHVKGGGDKITIDIDDGGGKLEDKAEDLLSRCWVRKPAKRLDPFRIIVGRRLCNILRCCLKCECLAGIGQYPEDWKYFIPSFLLLIGTILCIVFGVEANESEILQGFLIAGGVFCGVGCCFTFLYALIGTSFS